MEFGYTLLYVDDVKETMDFYAEAFGLEAGFLHESGEYGEMVTGKTKLGFVRHETASSHGFKYQKTKDLPPPFEIAFTTKNVEDAFKKAVKAGAEALSEPATKPWGQTVSYVKDCNGFLVEICSPM